MRNCQNSYWLPRALLLHTSLEPAHEERPLSTQGGTPTSMRCSHSVGARGEVHCRAPLSALRPQNPATAATATRIRAAASRTGWEHDFRCSRLSFIQAARAEGSFNGAWVPRFEAMLIPSPHSGKREIPAHT